MLSFALSIYYWKYYFKKVYIEEWQELIKNAEYLSVLLLIISIMLLTKILDVYIDENAVAEFSLPHRKKSLI